MVIVAKPTWEADILPLFSKPYWLPPAEQEVIARGWNACMKDYQLDLLDPVAVRESSITIFNHLASRNMPLTTDARQYWPIEALETFRRWVNQGWPIRPGDPVDPAMRIPPPDLPQRIRRVRPDIRSMSPSELDTFRAKLDDIMQVGNPEPTSPWQEYAYLHTNWCLHYQEAFALWHRAYLLYLEALIDHPIPYWDWMAENASVDGSPEAGLPQAFLEETYVHPETGERRLNPLRYAAAKDGNSKLCGIGQMSGPECRFVQRNPLFYTHGEDQKEARSRWYAMARLFQQQVVDALKFDVFSTPQGVPGYPWANLPAFTPPQPDGPYIYRTVNFDGLYEQPHDNYHGWIGPDMADNAYTAFDPVFLAYHSNIDRMLEVWIRAHPAAQFTTQVPLQPFVGADAAKISLSCPDRWCYTAIGDMARDSRSLGYDYGPPVARPFTGVQPRFTAGNAAMPDATGCSHHAAHAPAPQGPWIVFDGVRCTHDSYFIDVFLDQPEASAADINPENQHYVGRFSRIGMGLADDKGRCIRHGVSRVLDAGPVFRALGLDMPGQHESRAPVITTLVTELNSGRLLTPEEQRALPGFIPRLVVYGPAQSAPPPPADIGACCSHSPANPNPDRS